MLLPLSRGYAHFLEQGTVTPLALPVREIATKADLLSQPNHIITNRSRSTETPAFGCLNGPKPLRAAPSRIAQWWWMKAMTQMSSSQNASDAQMLLSLVNLRASGPHAVLLLRMLV